MGKFIKENMGKLIEHPNPYTKHFASLRAIPILTALLLNLFIYANEVVTSESLT